MRSLSSKASRDMRLDCVRGLALFFIFINHIPFNEAQFLTPSLWGWSDAAEAFVFCSGWVSAKVYGQTFKDMGLMIGCARLLPRLFQIYWAHIGLFIALILTSSLVDGIYPEQGYKEAFGAGYFFSDPQSALLSFVSLRYLPSWLDILPLYLVFLVSLPLFHKVSECSWKGAVWLSLCTYGIAFILNLNLSADPLSEREWFFNPFCWQLIFFAGFAFSRGWLKVRLNDPLLQKVSLGLVIVAIPFSRIEFLRTFQWMHDFHTLIDPLYEKQSLGPLRVLHFAAMAYLTSSLLTGSDRWVHFPLIGSISVLGRNSLAVFVFQLPLDWVCRVYLEQQGHGLADLALVNIGGLFLVMMVGHGIDWVSSRPWASREKKLGLSPDSLVR